jgi:hypothetical protein
MLTQEYLISGYVPHPVEKDEHTALLSRLSRLMEEGQAQEQAQVQTQYWAHSNRDKAIAILVKFALVIAMVWVAFLFTG